MLSVEHLVLDDVTLLNKRKAEDPTKGLQQSKRFRSFGERSGSGGGGGALAGARQQSTHAVRESGPTVTPRGCSLCGAYTHTSATYHRVTSNANRSVFQNETEMQEVMNFPSLQDLRN